MRQAYHEPIVQDAQASQIRGFPISITGTYVLLDDVVTVIREYAQTSPDPVIGGAIHELATWLQGGQAEDEPERVIPETPVAVAAAEGVDRIEVYPSDPEDPRPKWHARACSPEGDILYTTAGSFDQEYVIRDAQERWPGVNTHLIADASVDTVWEEKGPDAIRSPLTKRRRPSPKRLWMNT